MKRAVNDTSALSIRPDAHAIAQSLGNVAMAIGTPGFFDAAIRALRELVDFRNSDAVVVHWAGPADEPPVLVGVYSQADRYSRVIRERYLQYGFQFCPEISAMRNGLRSGIYSMAELGTESFLEPACYEAYYGLLEARNFYSLYGDLGDGRVVGWSISRHLEDADFTSSEDAAMREIAPLLIALMTRHCQLAVPAGSPSELDHTVEFRTMVADAVNFIAKESLTEREHEVALMLARGLPTKTVSRLLHISPQTEIVHRRNIYRKLRISSQVELLSYCLNRLLLPSK
jgi:DNA-binding CsgD family transcriptional regulator